MTLDEMEDCIADYLGGSYELCVDLPGLCELKKKADKVDLLVEGLRRIRDVATIARESLSTKPIKAIWLESFADELIVNATGE